MTNQNEEIVGEDMCIESHIAMPTRKAIIRDLADSFNVSYGTAAHWIKVQFADPEINALKESLQSVQEAIEYVIGSGKTTKQH